MTEYININETRMKRLWVQDLEEDGMWNVCDTEGKKGN